MEAVARRPLGKAGVSIFYWLSLPFSFLASLLRLGAGAPAPRAAQKQPIILYEFEGCPFCRFAREAVSQSGVSVLVRPCPKGGKRFRPAVRELGGKAQFPYLVDDNTGARMYESEDIAAYLHKTYGGRRSLMRFLGPINHILSQLAVLARFASGTFRRRSTAPEKPLEFVGAERDPRARLVKERLCEMELEYLWRPAGEGDAAPLLIDRNRNETIAGAHSILKYLKAAYRL